MTSAAVGLAREGVWPSDDRKFASARDMAEIFASEVLGWDQADVVLDPAAPDSPGRANHLPRPRPVGAGARRSTPGQVDLHADRE